MPIQSLFNIRQALKTLNPNQAREMSERQVRVALHAASQESYQRMENFFLRDLSPSRRRQSALLLSRAPIQPLGQQVDFSVYDEGVVAPHGELVFRPDHTHQFVEKTLLKHPDLGVSLARSFLPFRKPFIERLIAKTARENAMFSLATALPDIIPSIIELPWAVAEFASDMAFLIAAASDRPVGYLEQKSEIATVIGSAFGWRALARQLIGKVPFGGGMLAKAAVAYAGTKVLGLSLDHFYSIGFTYTREEREEIYIEAFRQGKKVAAKILGYLRPDLAAKYADANRPISAPGPGLPH